jgi:hypothetical protein
MSKLWTVVFFSAHWRPNEMDRNSANWNFFWWGGIALVPFLWLNERGGMVLGGLYLREGVFTSRHYQFDQLHGSAVEIEIIPSDSLPQRLNPRPRLNGRSIPFCHQTLIISASLSWVKRTHTLDIGERPLRRNRLYNEKLCHLAMQISFKFKRVIYILGRDIYLKFTLIHSS